MSTTIFVVSIGLNAILAWTTYVQYVKNNTYENDILVANENMQQVFQKISTTLHTMRMLDEKRMFESDDEVGSVFQQLVDVVNDMRPMIYGVDDEEN